MVQAGLIPVLRARGGWAVGALRPGPEPWRSLAGCLLELIEGEPATNERVKRVIETGKLAGELAGNAAADPSAPGGASVEVKHLVDATLDAHPDSRRLLLLVDQWEELYTYPQNTAAGAAAFADRLVEATQCAPLTVVLTLRADFTGRAIDHRPLRDRLQQATVFLGGMTRTERELAISGPAQVAGLRFEAGLVGRILDDVGDEPGNLPLLEFCLTQLYARRQDSTLCQAAYEAIGGVRGAMASQHAGRKAPIRDVFLQLVQLGEGSEDTRRRAPLAAFDAAARTLIGELATARLLVTGRDPGSKQETVEVAHEALIRNWPRLRNWLQEDRANLQQRREVARATAAWQAHGDSYRWPDERVIRESAPMLRRLGSRSWIEAMAYCQWVSTALGYPVRLPTEWEWQQAATGGDPRSEYPWGDWREGCANTSESDLGRMTAVGLYPHGASAQGVLDLAGNAWDWCLNKFDTPSDVEPGGAARRVVRGGSWSGYRGLARCAYRVPSVPGLRDHDVGLRVVCVSPILAR